MVKRFLSFLVLASSLPLCCAAEIQIFQTPVPPISITNTQNPPEDSPKKRDKPGSVSSSLTALLGIPDSQLGPINLVLNCTPHILQKAPQLVQKTQFKDQFNAHYLGQSKNKLQLTTTKDFASFFATMLIPMDSALPRRDIPWSAYLNLSAGLLNLGETSRKHGSVLTKSIIPTFLAYEQTKSLLKRFAIIRRLKKRGKITTIRSIPEHMQDQEYLVFQSHFGYLLRMLPQLVHNYDVALKATKTGVEATRNYLGHEWARITVKKGCDFAKETLSQLAIFYAKWKGFDAPESQAPKESNESSMKKYYEDNLFKYYPTIDPYLEATPPKIDKLRSYTSPADKQLQDQYLACALLALPIFPHCYILQSDYDQLSVDDQIAIASFAFEDWSFTLKLLVDLGCLFGAGIDMEKSRDLA